MIDHKPYLITETPQEAYDKIKAYFSLPDAKLSYTPRGNGNPYTSQCYYRHPEDGRKCAVGVLIPDGVADNALGSLTSLLLDRLIEVEKEGTRSFLFAVQPLHDNATSVPDFLLALDKLAAEDGLDT